MYIHIISGIYFIAILICIKYFSIFGYKHHHCVPIMRKLRNAAGRISGYSALSLTYFLVLAIVICSYISHCWEQLHTLEITFMRQTDRGGERKSALHCKWHLSVSTPIFGHGTNYESHYAIEEYHVEMWDTNCIISQNGTTYWWCEPNLGKKPFRENVDSEGVKILWDPWLRMEDNLNSYSSHLFPHSGNLEKWLKG
jgi:hypothetical protein